MFYLTPKLLFPLYIEQLTYLYIFYVYYINFIKKITVYIIILLKIFNIHI